MGNAHPYLVPSQEVRELELSGGVRSLAQVPWWNTGRRARPKRRGGASRLLRGAPRTPLCADCGIPRLPAFPLPLFLRRHCEERSDEAIQNLSAALDCFASLAMTRKVTSLFDITSAHRRSRDRDSVASAPTKVGEGDPAFARWRGRLTRRFVVGAEISSRPAPRPPRKSAVPPPRYRGAGRVTPPRAAARSGGRAWRGRKGAPPRGRCGRSGRVRGPARVVSAAARARHAARPG